VDQFVGVQHLSHPQRLTAPLVFHASRRRFGID